MKFKIYLLRSIHLTLIEIVTAILLTISMIGKFDLVLFAKTWLILSMNFFGIPLFFVWTYPIWAIYIIVMYWIGAIFTYGRWKDEEA
ncbi:hypothetical protein DRN93_00280 [archaeon]|nr:MAG: hypothetical protein DRN93_00280 [archaeon]